jgi:hypothetical protein
MFAGGGFMYREEREEGERPCGGGSLWAWACDACQRQASVDPYVLPAVRFSVYPSGRTFLPHLGRQFEHLTFLTRSIFQRIM